MARRPAPTRPHSRRASSSRGTGDGTTTTAGGAGTGADGSRWYDRVVDSVRRRGTRSTAGSSAGEASPRGMPPAGGGGSENDAGASCVLELAMRRCWVEPSSRQNEAREKKSLQSKNVISAPTENRTQGNCLEGNYVTTTPLARCADVGSSRRAAEMKPVKKNHCDAKKAISAPTENRTQGNCLEGNYVTTTPLAL